MDDEDEAISLSDTRTASTAAAQKTTVPPVGSFNLAGVNFNEGSLDQIQDRQQEHLQRGLPKYEEVQDIRRTGTVSRGLPAPV